MTKDRALGLQELGFPNGDAVAATGLSGGLEWRLRASVGA
jgi:hypothetical protein